MRVVLTGGGTGGHVFPALAVADRIRATIPDAQIMFVGTRRGLEATVVPKAGYDIGYVHARGLAAHPIRMAHALLDNAVGMAESFGKLRRFAPTVVIGCGGYVSLPVCAAAQAMRIPTVLLEQNLVPGKTTKFLASRAVRVCISFDATAPLLDLGARVLLTGNPVRKEILERTRAAGRAAMGVPAEAFCILVTGASQGARTVNEAVVAALPRWKERPWHVLHLTGRGDYGSVKARAEASAQGGPLRWDPRAFLDDMASAYAAADLVVARAGATTMAEITCRGLPAVLIPYPHAGAHQVDNARWLEGKGAAEVILNDAAVDGLASVIEALAQDSQRLAGMAEASRRAGHPDAVDRIVAEVVAAAGVPTGSIEDIEGKGA